MYKCYECETFYVPVDASVEGVERIRCIDMSTVVENCLHYYLNQQTGKYFCNVCENDLTLATDASKVICVHNTDLRTHCIEYIDNGPSE